MNWTLPARVKDGHGRDGEFEKYFYYGASAIAVQDWSVAMAMQLGTIVHRNEWLTQPWKNGGGITHEVWRWCADPARCADPAAYDVRLSVAEIEGAQPFSQFTDFERVLIPLEENSLQIVLGDAIAPMTKHRAFHFSGDLVARTQGVGRAMDFNVIARRSLAAQVVIATSENHEAPEIRLQTRARHLAVFALEATTLSTADASQQALAPFDTLLRVSGEGDVALTASRPVVWIRFG